MSQQAAQINNVGVALMHSWKLNEALNVFRQAMTKMMELAATSSAPGKIFAYQMLSGKDVVRSIGNYFDQKQSVVRNRSNHESMSLLSSMPFIIDGRPGAYSNDCFLNMTVISAIILFNIGILHQIHGLEVSGVGRELIKACHLYEKCRLLLCEAGVSLSPTGNPVVDILYMAVTNNLSQLSCDLARFDASRCYQYLLVEFAVLVQPTLYASVQTADIVGKETRNFLLKSALRFIPEVAPAA